MLSAELGIRTSLKEIFRFQFGFPLRSAVWTCHHLYLFRRSALKFRRFVTIASLLCVLWCCSGDNQSNRGRPVFVKIPSSHSHIDFANELTEGLNTNILMYEYFYNGGGVAIGDLNADGLDDIYFSANMSSNRLYVNRGKMHFEDVTEQSATGGRPGPWKTGVVMADVNGDSMLDIYVCYSGKVSGAKRVNQLFINQGSDEKGIPHFSEEAARYGIADSSFTTQAVFFDYDRDNDLDLLLLNHNPKRLNNLNDSTISSLLKKEDSLIGLKLLNNNNGVFKQVTRSAGIRNSPLSYGLGAGVSDVNDDGWPDIYISNDYDVPDYLYINNGDGSFSDQTADQLGHTSHFSMGNDIADINNDAAADIISLDMLPADNRRQKLLFSPDNYAAFDLKVRAGFHHQYMRNMLHLNNGNGTFSEIGQLSGISNTDWSWAPLCADFDNDGWKDLFISNGFTKDFTNMDFVKFANDRLESSKKVWRKDLLNIVQQMPSSGVVNYLFRNNGDLTFENVTSSWGIDLASNSNGAAYGDLDNDGDLDLVVNNINEPASIFQNETRALTGNHFLKIRLKGPSMNTYGLGAKVTLYTKRGLQFAEQMPSRGYQSTVSPLMHFGLGMESVIDSLIIDWPSGTKEVLLHPTIDRLLTLDEKNAVVKNTPTYTPAVIAHEVTCPVRFLHHQNKFNDFRRQPLMTTPMSFSGPALAKADVNQDGLDDIYAGGGAGQPGVLFFQAKDGLFHEHMVPSFITDKECDDTGAVFFDANNDAFPDLYVCSGGYHHYESDDTRLQDRLYLNDGKGNFVKSLRALPSMLTSSSCVRVNDINNDGHPDLFVGGRVIPGRYPESPLCYVLINDTKGNFIDRTLSIAPSLQKIGMVTDAVWLDLNEDKRDDLIVVGDWMPVMVFLNEDEHLIERSSAFFDKRYSGCWNHILTGDFNKDGQADLLIGNLGLNSQLKATDGAPAELIFRDFDTNGSVDPFMSFYVEGKSYPYVTRDELIEQLGGMRQRFPDYKSYADATIEDIFTADQLIGAKRLEVTTLETTYFQRTPNGKFSKNQLPLEAQFAPVFTMISRDFDADGNEDVLLAGNMNHARLRFGKYDANYGILLKGNGNGAFTYVAQTTSGFALKGDVRSMISLDNLLLFGINGQPLRAYRYNHRTKPESKK